MSKVDDIISGVILREGSKYTNDPKDSGGPTKYGVTQATLSRYRKRQVTPSEVAALTESEARSVYRMLFVNEPGYGPIVDISDLIGAELVDTGVNMGPARASMFLQQGLNALNRNGRDFADVGEDGACGPRTVVALKAYLSKRGREGETVLHRVLNCLQGAYYIDLARRRPKDEEYVYGWFRERVS